LRLVFSTYVERFVDNQEKCTSNGSTNATEAMATLDGYGPTQWFQVVLRLTGLLITCMCVSGFRKAGGYEAVLHSGQACW